MAAISLEDLDYRLDTVRSQLADLENERKEWLRRDHEERLRPWRELATCFHQLLQAKAPFLNSGHWCLLALGSQIAPHPYAEVCYGFVRSSSKDYATLYLPNGDMWQERQTWWHHEALCATRNREGCTNVDRVPTADLHQFLEKVKSLGHSLAGQGAVRTADGLRFVTPEMARVVLRKALDLQCDVETVWGDSKL